MSEFSVIQAVGGELRRQIVEILDTTPDSDFGLDGDPDRVALESPGATLASGTVASLYLYHLDIDGHLRNQSPLPSRDEPDRFRRPPLPLKLRFLFTPVNDDEETNLLVLGRVIQHFHDSPTFDAVLGRALGDSFGGAPATLRVRIEMLPLADLTQLWSALSTSFRLSVTLMVDIVAIDSGRVPMQTVRIGELVAGFGQSGRRR